MSIKIRIYIVFILTVLSFFWLTPDDKEDFKAGKDSSSGIMHVTAYVEPVETIQTDFTIESVSIKVERSFQLWEYLFIMVEGIGGLVSLICFLQLMLSVRKKKVFIRPNVYRMRIIVYTFMVVIIYLGVTGYLAYQIAGQSLSLPGYQPENYSFPFASLMAALLLAIFTEVYAQGVKMKEEQELTI